jgi:hypothetical protein
MITGYTRNLSGLRLYEDRVVHRAGAFRSSRQCQVPSAKCQVRVRPTGRRAKTKCDVSKNCFIARLWIFFRDLFYRVFDLPLLRKAKKHDKKKSKKTEGKKTYFL